MRTFAVVILTGLGMVAGGCSTAVTVKTDPPGATIWARGSGRNAYKWEEKGVADSPLTYKSPYSADRIVAVWDGKTKSEEIRVRHIVAREVSVEIVKPKE